VVMVIAMSGKAGASVLRTRGLGDGVCDDAVMIIFGSSWLSFFDGCC